MKLFIAGIGVPKETIFQFRAEQQAKGKEIAFLHSFLEVKGNGEILTKNLSIDNRFLDSGAYTAFTQGKEIDIDEYCKTIKRLDIKYYAGLDVIGDYKATKRNIEYMEAQGLKPIPTFHFGSPIEELERLLNNYNYIALGGLVPHAANRPKLKKWLDYCYSVITKREKLTKTHLFGINSIWAWERYPIYSADATSWVAGSKFRRIVEYDNKAHRFKTHHKGNHTYFSHKIWESDYKELNLHNIIEYQKAADDITNLWERRGIKWEN